MDGPCRTLLCAFAVVCCLAPDAQAQYFGRNKVQYDREDVRVLATEHFDLYYSQEDADAAIVASRMAERWYARLSKALQHALSDRQPLILYGSHRRFEQTNVWAGFIDENTGGFTESRKRRIVLPFAATLAETDHVLGHEIVHAFQYDIAARYRRPLTVPLWFIEGMAEYLTVGPADPLTDMWMRDAVQAGKLPRIDELGSPRYFPYRWGAALWAHLVDRFGADLPAKALRERRDVKRRLQELTGESIESLTTAWHDSLREQYTAADAQRADGSRALISSRRDGGRLNLAGALSPDGRRIIFLSERDQFSIDLFLADAATGRVIRKLITTATSAEFESLQYLQSAGAWDPEGTRFAVATVRSGRPALVLLDVDAGGRSEEIPLPSLDEVYSPTWAPDARAIAFSAMKGGVTNLFVLDLRSRHIRQLTNDQYADLQPSWSPDGRTIAFTTDRFSADLEALRFGGYRIALLDVESGAIAAALPVAANQFSPAWSPDGESLYFVADPGGVSNLFRLSRADAQVFQLTHEVTGVSGVTRLSPAFSVAAGTGAIAYNSFRRSGYDIHVIAPALASAGTRIDALPVAQAAPVPAEDGDGEIATVPPLPRVAQRGAVAGKSARYQPALSLEAIGTPYFSAGSGSFGGQVQGGASLLFGDLLGDRRLMAAVHVSSRLDESAFGAVYVDRTSRWTWGLTVDQAPEVRLRTTRVTADPTRDGVVVRDRERWLRTYRHAGAFVAYPLNRSQRVEFSAGFRHIAFDNEMTSESLSALTGRVLDERSQPFGDMASIGLVEAGVAVVGDTAVFGATGPMIGTRYRFQVTPATGGMSYTSVLADYRRYMMPIRPYTFAFRLLHSARYGGDAADARLRETYLGSSAFVRGYGANSVVRSECRGSSSDCPALNRMLGIGLLVAKFELRVPVLSAMSSRVRYGPIPADAFVFADAGRAWGGELRFGPTGTEPILVRSLGAGVRVNAIGMILELAAVRPLDLNRSGWTYAFTVRPGF